VPESARKCNLFDGCPRRNTRSVSPTRADTSEVRRAFSGDSKTSRHHTTRNWHAEKGRCSLASGVSLSLIYSHFSQTHIHVRNASFEQTSGKPNIIVTRQNRQDPQKSLDRIAEEGGRAGVDVEVAAERAVDMSRNTSFTSAMSWGGRGNIRSNLFRAQVLLRPDARLRLAAVHEKKVRKPTRERLPDVRTDEDCRRLIASLGIIQMLLGHSSIRRIPSRSEGRQWWCWDDRVRAGNRLEIDQWLAVKNGGVRSRKPCGVRTRDKSTERTPPWAETKKRTHEESDSVPM
jgi:hypothetical protein